MSSPNLAFLRLCARYSELVAALLSHALAPSIIETHRRGEQIALRFQLRDPFAAEKIQERAMILHAKHVFLQPMLEAFASARRLVIFEIKIVVAPGVPLGR